MKTILNKTLEGWICEYPLIEELVGGGEVLWSNDKKEEFELAIKNCPIGLDDILDASARLERFAAYFKVAYPETQKTDGIIESPIAQAEKMKAELMKKCGFDFDGRFLIKLDSNLPISGSIKARGGIYEVLCTAEKIAIEAGYLKEGDDYSVFASEKFRELFSKYTIAVGSTGNLGLSIGLVGAKLGFRAEVHMSADARQWKKDMLRKNGAIVIEYAGDYSLAVAEGRKVAEKNPYCHFVDDENSKTLFFGYAVAALRLKKQLEYMNITVDKNNPLFVYLPCGVGGGPGGVAFGLKLMFGDNVNCFFAEPTESCCMTLGMMTEMHNAISVGDFGIGNHTIADGLAVGRASGFVGKTMMPFMSGCYTITDKRMSALLAMLFDTEGIFLEPSALAGVFGPCVLNKNGKYKKGTHVAWATGGGMVPPEERKKYYEDGIVSLNEIDW
ncbi:MAG: D-serine ammonia-lyase [Clostridia bacterium]|nr:D-serine ammonia-lyase [Clostridia bacterium]